MPLRSPRERLLQSLLFELGGLLIAAPLYQCIAGTGAADSFALVAAIAVVVALWSPVHNTAFDAAEFWLVRRVASDRPQALRILHAASHELSSMLVSVPVILAMTLYDLVEALLVDVGLSAVYTVYAFVFHNLFDLWRPVRQGGRRS